MRKYINMCNAVSSLNIDVSHIWPNMNVNEYREYPNIICNNCIGARLYEVSNLEFPNPVMWCATYYEDFIYFIKNYDNIDLSKYIHPDSNIESLKIMSYSYNGIKSNKIPCTVRELVEYNTAIEKIDKKHWPACSIRLTKKTQQFMVCSQIVNGDISTVMKACNLISSDHVGGTIVI